MVAGAVADGAAVGTVDALPALEAVGLTKSFGAVTVLDDVSLRLPAGSFHALLGENGAGKSTLVKCIMGYYRADAGRVLVRGAEARIKSPRDAAALGIGMVYQHFTLVDNMTVAENLVLSRQQHPFLFDWRAERARRLGVHGTHAVSPRSAAAGADAGGRREAEARDSQAAVSRQRDRDPRRADVGPDARTRRTRCWDCCGT